MSYRSIREKVVKTRKDHACEWCDTKIDKGTKAHYRAYTLDDDFKAGYMHVECEQAMVRESGVDGGGITEWSPGDFKRGKTAGESDD